MVLSKVINMELVQMSTEACEELTFETYNVLRETYYEALFHWIWRAITVKIA